MRGCYHRESDDYEPTEDEIVEEVCREKCSICGKVCYDGYWCGCGDYFFACDECIYLPTECVNCRMMNEEY